MFAEARPRRRLSCLLIDRPLLGQFTEPTRVETLEMTGMNRFGLQSGQAPEARPRVTSIRSGQVEKHLAIVESIACEQGLCRTFEYRDKARRVSRRVKDFEASVTQIDRIAVRDQPGVRRGPHRIGFGLKIRRRPCRKGLLRQPAPPQRGPGVGFASTSASAA